MGNIKNHSNVKLFAGILVNTSALPLLDLACQHLSKQFGRIDIFSDTWDFNFTHYYAEEMGEKLSRKFVAFANLIPPENLTHIKLWTNRLEEHLAGQYTNFSRPINIDPGYVSLAKVVLATTKDYSHRLYIGNGIYEEITLGYEGKKYTPLPWTYPDYRTDMYITFFHKVRENYKKLLLA